MIFGRVFICAVLNIPLVDLLSVLVSRAYMFIDLTQVLYFLTFASMLMYLLLKVTSSNAFVILLLLVTCFPTYFARFWSLVISVLR